MYIKWLDEISGEHGELVGGKALGLAALVQAGLNVPAGFCINTRAYRQALTSNALDDLLASLPQAKASQAAALAGRLHSGLREGTLPEELEEEVSSAYATLMEGEDGPFLVAVRSSATSEDTASASYAGQQATILNVGDRARLLRAVRECWASLWSPAATAYRVELAEHEQAPEMAVLVQRLVPADAAGVAFSQDPIGPSEHMVIEATYGLGTTVVGGLADVDRYVVSRATLTEVGQPSIALKTTALLGQQDGSLQESAVPAARAKARVLSPAQVGEVAQLCQVVERLRQCPQDVEWAYNQGQLYVLQARPITSDASFFTDLVADAESLWTSGFLNERFTLPVSPLGWTLVRELLEELAFRDPLRYLGLQELPNQRLTRLYRGHPYVNAAVFQALYKPFPEAALPEDASRYFPGGDTSLRRLAPYPRSWADPRMWVSLLRHFLHEPCVWLPWTNYLVWRSFARRHQGEMQALRDQWAAVKDTASATQKAWDLVDRAQAVNRTLLGLHRWSLTHADIAYSLLRRLTPPAARSWVARMTAGLPSRSLEANRALEELAAMQEPQGREARLHAFLTRFGHRSFHLDIYYPTFAEDPALVLQLAEHIHAARPARSSSGKTRSPGNDQTQTDIEEPATFGSGVAGRIRRLVFGHVLQLARRYMALREEQRFHWQETLAFMRSIYLWLGHHLASQGSLASADDVFFLTRDELGGLRHGEADPGDLRRRAARRKQDFHRLRAEFEVAPQTSYPDLLRGNRPVVVQPDMESAQLQGRGVSPGLGQGRAVIAHTPEDLQRLVHGDVLVAPGVDPGWTPAFSLLSGLVTEHGGQLSHAAVVAREYRLPAVVGVARATAVLHEGERLLVDGLAGTVLRLDLSPETSGFSISTSHGSTALET